MESKTASASGEVELRQNSSKLNNIGGDVQQSGEGSSNMLITSYGVVAAKLWRGCPQDVISTGRTTEEEEKPCHLCFRYSAQIVEELAFIFEFVLEDVLTKRLRAER